MVLQLPRLTNVTFLSNVEAVSYTIALFLFATITFLIHQRNP